MPPPTFDRTPETWLDFDPTRTRPARGRAAAATAHPMASWAATTILHQGGSAIDAAIAAQAMLTLVEPNASGIGGGAIILAHDGARVRVFDGLSAAPARVTAKLALDFDGRTVPSDRAVYGGRTVGIPGALRALELAHRSLGKLPWVQLFAPAIAAAHDGFPLAPYLWRALQESPGVRDEAMARTLFCRDGAALPPGTLLRNAALGDTLEDIARHGAGALYRGDIADRICRAVAGDSFPGTITRDDLDSYRAIERAPLIYPHGSGHIATAPLPAYGGIAAGQIVGIAAALGLHGLDECPDEDAAHLLAECGRVAHADRAPYADPDHVDIDTAHLLDPHYLARRSKLIDRARRTDRIPAGRADGSSSMTSHLSVADGRGQVVALTTTINQNFGARIAVGGFYLNNVMTNFANEPVLRGRPDPNAIAPGKRARTTIAPSIVLDVNGNPTAALGAGGGFRIIGYVANALLRLAAGQRDPQALVAAPHVLNWSGLTELEPALEHLAPGLAARGHWLGIRRLDGGTQCIILHEDGTISAGGDPRRDGVGMAFKP
jgi:gamma-glutamyltranspeptidase/glutathione hydrolase